MVTGCTDDPDILHYCKTAFKDETIARWKCISKSEENKKKVQVERDAAIEREKAREARDIAARPCLAADVTRIENVARKIKESITKDMSIEDVTAKLKILGLEGGVQIPEDDLKQKVFVANISTNCVSDFYILLNIRFFSDREISDNGYKVRWLRFYMNNPPNGYYFPIANNDFESEVARKRQDKIEFAQQLLANLPRSPDLADWASVGIDSGSTFYVDKGTIKKDADLRIFWLIRNCMTPDLCGSRSNAILLEFDCSGLNPKFFIRQNIYYSEQMGHGKILGHEKLPKDWQSDGSGLGRNISRLVCAQQ